LFVSLACTRTLLAFGHKSFDAKEEMMDVARVAGQPGWLQVWSASCKVKRKQVH
jgi:hypothetical protein